MRLVVFDLDNTLVDRAARFRRWAASFVARHGLAPGEAAWLETNDGDGFIPRDEFLSLVRERYGLPEPVDALVRRFRMELSALVEPDPRVSDALARLRDAGWRIGIATNGTTYQQWSTIRNAGLAGLVDAVAVSEEVGVAKPDRRMFEAVADRCGAPLSDGGWMVGDCPRRDIAGGQGVGLRTIWVRRGRTWDATARTPDAIVDDVSMVLAVLDGL